jgi:chromosome segregation ATPase
MEHLTQQGTEKNICTLELTLIDTKEQLELGNQTIKELQARLRDKENEINFLKDILSSRTTLVFHQVNTIAALQATIAELRQKAESPVIVMKTYATEMEELSETAI